MQRKCSVLILLLLLLLLRIGASECYAQTPAPNGPVQGSLVNLINSGEYAFNSLERLSATANQASYNALTSNPSSGTYCNPQLAAASPTCSSAVFLVFSNVRSLVQTANALLANGQATRYSLNLDDQGLGNALRWTAAEELTAPGAAATQFSNSQITSVASRITALRFGASGFSVAGLGVPSDAEAGLAATEPRSRGGDGGGASADSADIGGASRWGGFLNGSFGWGDRAPSALEDAFAFDSRDATLGIDYRFNRHLVLGAAAGYTKQRIDFDSNLSVVGGGIDSDGYSFQIFALYDWDGPYASVSIGAQRMRYDSTRLITYPSLNIVVPSVDALAIGATNSDALSGTFEIGWSLAHKAFGFEPYLSGDYQHIRLAGFTESSHKIGGADAGAPAGFDFDYAGQHITFLDSALGTRFQYTFSPRFGVAVAYFKAEYHHLFDNTPGAVVSSYNAIANTGAAFDIPSDKPDANFFQFAVGSSFVFSHGIQAFLQYQQSAGITNVSSHLISAGFRGAF
jgi:outer membrane autotransporter protein